jgi:hypothetical protein
VGARSPPFPTTVLMYPREDKLFGYADGTRYGSSQTASPPGPHPRRTSGGGRRAAGQPADRGAEGRRTAWFFVNGSEAQWVVGTGWRA